MPTYVVYLASGTTVRVQGTSVERGGDVYRIKGDGEDALFRFETVEAIVPAGRIDVAFGVGDDPDASEE